MEDNKGRHENIETNASEESNQNSENIESGVSEASEEGKERKENLESEERVKNAENTESVEKKEETFDLSSSYTNNLPMIFKKLNITLAITSYQTARLFFIKSDGKQLETNFKHYPRPMGIYADEERITLGTFSEVMEFKRSDDVLAKIKAGDLDDEENLTRKIKEKNKERIEAFRKRKKEELEEIKESDALYLPRASITTGMINIHDIAWGDEGLWVVNSTFSCLSTLSPDCSFISRWTPPFISELAPEDRCHLNGMAMKDGKPKYVTTFNQQDNRDSWTKENRHDGTLIDVDTNEILLDGLIMPHSPRYYRGYVYVCESGRGQVWRYDPKTKEKKLFIQLQGFTRGMNFHGGILFVGLSKSRASEVKNTLPLNEMYDETFSGMWLINMDDGSEIGHIKFKGDLHQIYDVAVIPEASGPTLLKNNSILTRHIFDYQEVTK